MSAHTWRISKRALTSCCITLFAVAPIAACGAESDALGAIEGRLTDSRGRALKSGHAVVFLCDAESGMPLSAETRKLINLGSNAMLRFDQFWHAVTNGNGGFSFKDVPTGSYRLVAQAWSGVSGAPRGVAKSLSSEPGVEPSSVVILHGTAEGVTVTAGETTRAVVRQWGDDLLRIETDPEEPHNYLLISHHPPIGEGVLGPLGWGQEFMAGVIGVTRMEDSHATVVGMPAGAAVHVRLWNYDNIAGTGGGSFVVGKDKPATLPIYAGWSNGKDEPPRHLAKLTAHLENTKLDVSSLLQFDVNRRDAYGDFLKFIWSHPNEKVEVEGYGEVRILDLLAADSYRELREYHREQKERRTARQTK